MAYTVKKLAAMSGVSVRTLHYYDEVGLLKPAYCGANGYRFYKEEQILRLQQILFYRELDLGLKQIQEILGRSDFDRAIALESHRNDLKKELARKGQLLATIDKTIEHLKGTKKMDNKDMFQGFDPKQQRKHEQYLVDRYGDDMKQSIAKSNAKVKNWSKEKWERTQGDFADICVQLVGIMEQGLPPECDEAQKQIRRHFDWICQFWTPNRDSYKGHCQLIVDSELRKAYTTHHIELPEFVTAGIEVFSNQELSSATE